MTTMTHAGRVPADSLPNRLILLRRDLGNISQRAAALMCGLTFGEWQSMEDGRESRNLNVKIQKIADNTGYDRNWLMWGGPLVVPEPPDDGQECPREDSDLRHSVYNSVPLLRSVA